MSRPTSSFQPTEALAGPLKSDRVDRCYGLHGHLYTGVGRPYGGIPRFQVPGPI